MTHRIAELAAEIVASGLATASQMAGCSPGEVAEIERKFPVKLPEVYRDWLLAMGRGAGDYLKGSDAFYPEILVIREWADELLAEDGRPIVLPSDAFVFLMHQGYQFLYFRTAEGVPDPPVLYYFTGAHKDGWESLTSYYFQVLQDHLQLRKGS